MKRGRYMKSVREALPESAHANWDRAFGGDALAARRMMIVAPRRLRGHIAFLAYQVNLGNPAYREIMKAVWAPETRHLLTAFWRPAMVRRMLVRADFRVPEFNAPVTVFRHANGRSSKAAAELSWSLSRERVVAEAVRARAERPKILQATVDPADIVFWSNRHGEQEIVSRRPIEGAVVIDPATILRGAARAKQSRARDNPATSHQH